MSTIKSILWVLLVSVVAALVIFAYKGEVPKHLTRDEIEFARFAMLLSNMPYTPYDSYATGHASLYFYILLGAFKLFGLSQEALRLPSAIFGVLGGVSVYVLFRLVWQDKQFTLRIPGIKQEQSIELAGIAALIFVTQRWYYNFARYSFEATFLIFLEVVPLASMYAFLRFKRIPWLVTSAVFAGLAYNSYQPGRLFVLVPLLLLVLHKPIRSLKHIGVYCVVFAMMIAPLTVYFMQHHDTRLKQQLYFADPNLTPVEKLQFLGTNIVTTKAMFLTKGDVSGLHNYPYKPAITLIIFAFMAFGLVRAFVHCKDKNNIVFMTYAALAIVPTLLTYTHENPNMLRTVTYLVPMMYFVGYGLLGIQAYAQKLHMFPLAKKYVGLLMMSMLLLSAVLDARTYFVFQRKVFSESFEIKDGFAGVYVFMRERDIPLGDLKLSPKEYQRYKELTE